jgi:hypothetical protein
MITKIKRLYFYLFRLSSFVFLVFSSISSISKVFRLSSFFFRAASFFLFFSDGTFSHFSHRLFLQESLPVSDFGSVHFQTKAGKARKAGKETCLPFCLSLPAFVSFFCLPVCLFLPAFVSFLACLCVFSCLPLCLLFLPAFVLCAFSCLPLCLFLPAFVPFLACLCAFKLRQARQDTKAGKVLSSHAFVALLTFLCCAFPSLPLCLSLPAFVSFLPACVSFLACLCVFSCLPLCLFLPAFSLPLCLSLPAFVFFLACLWLCLVLPAFVPFHYYDVARHKGQRNPTTLSFTTVAAPTIYTRSVPSGGGHAMVYGILTLSGVLFRIWSIHEPAMASNAAYLICSALRRSCH